MMFEYRNSACLVIGLCLAAAPVAAEVDFAREVLPVLSDKCFHCHGPDTRKAKDLRLDSFDAATADRDGIRAIVPGKPQDSELVHRIFDTDDPMPPEDADKQLTEAERDLLKRWVAEGGEYAEHWSFVAPVRETGGSIDALIGERLRAEGVEFAPAADPATLLRRTALVLTGLPPEPSQVEAFAEDPSPQAFGRFVEELFASPRYGEHQARYWLDAVRYGDTHGLHLDNRRGIYPYRDWVIMAFNENQPFDEFLTWQIAGDLLPDPTMEQLVATGFVRMNPTTSEGGVIPEEFQAKNNFDRVESFGTALLGLSLNCVRCHTHKYDPILHEEYFQLMAFFNSTEEQPLDGNAYVYGPHLRVPADLTAWQRWRESVAETDRVVAAVAPADLDALRAHAKTTLGLQTSGHQIARDIPADKPRPAAAAWKPLKGMPEKVNLPGRGNQATWVTFQIQPVVRHPLVLRVLDSPGHRVFVDGKALAGSGEFVLELAPGAHSIDLKLVGNYHRVPARISLHNPWQAFAEGVDWEALPAGDRLSMLATRDPVAAELARSRAELEAAFTTTLIARELPEPRPTHVLERGEYNLPIGEPLSPGPIRVAGAFPADAPANRLGLAQWVTSPDNPLTSRVLVNRIWQRVFGEGLVRTPEDFGLQGEQPTHPALLDWLALEFQQSGWDLQHMLRLMVISRAFQQDSARRPGIDDPQNRLLARGPSFRLDAEVIRDIGLWAGGLLDPVMGGEGVKPYQPAGMWAAIMHPASNTKLYETDSGDKVYRRSLYVYWKRTSPHPMMTLFDAPSRETSCVRRTRSNTALQSLGLLNENQRVEMASAFARQLIESDADPASRIDELFRRVASREPDAVERASCQQLLARLAGRSEQDAWTQLTSIVLASDAAILVY